nr:gamma-aminobutyric acid receptor-associated protein-like [Procambarus clarkii]
MKVTWLFQQQHTLEERTLFARKMMRRHIGNVPIVLGRDPRSRSGVFDEMRISVPGNLTVVDLRVALRRKLQVRSRASVVFFINNTIPSSTDSLVSLYMTHKDSDRFLYMSFCDENVFGAQN